MNGGYKNSPKINLETNYHKERVLKESTSKKLIFYYEVVKKGTGKKAKVEGIDVGGKT